MPKYHKDFLDSSAGGSFTNNKKGDSWKLLETISKNAENWGDRKSTRLNSSHITRSRMPSSA